MMTSTSVTAAVTSRAVQLMPRLNHQSSAQYITTGTTISSWSSWLCMAALAVRRDGDPDVDAAAEFYAGRGALDPDEARAVDSTGVSACCSSLQRQRLVS